MKNWNKDAILSVVCSTIAWFIFWWLGVAGIAYGVRALKTIKETNEKGKVLAIIGIASGVVGMIIYNIGKYQQIYFN